MTKKGIVPITLFFTSIFIIFLVNLSNAQEQKQSEFHFERGTISGLYGASTFRILEGTQKRVGFIPDGIAGAQPFLALGARQTTPVRPPEQYRPTKGVSSSDDVMLLARAIHAEAEAEPYIGKVAVGAVLLNRVAHGSFPNSLSGVVYQGRALESVANGRVNTRPSKDSIRAAREALNGWDPTYGSLYFWNPSKRVSRWIWTRKIVVRYGAHVFGK